MAHLSQTVAMGEEKESKRSFVGRAFSSANMERQSSRRGLFGRKESGRRLDSSRNLVSSTPSEHRRKVEPSDTRLKKSSSSRGLTTGRHNKKENSLEAASFHGVPTNASRSSKSHSRAVPARHKSSDNMDTNLSGRRDDLGATTLHGKSTVSHIRSERNIESHGKTNSSRASSDRRTHMKRAMSRENVKRPEEYGQASSSAAPSQSKSMYGGTGDARRGRRRPKPAIVEEDSESSGSDDDSFAESQSRRRDFLVLLRENKTVNQKDFQDKENRRILHFLLYQHKLGVDLADLQADVDQDIAMNGRAAFQRPIPPLFVEPAN